MSPLRHRGVFLALTAFALSLAGVAQGPALPPALPLVHVNNGTNSEAAQKAHYLVLVSLDGFRWDYAAQDGAKHLLALGKQGSWAPQGMIPSFPSLTFPNHVTIVTGLYPEHHGIVANSFFDPQRQARYASSDFKAVADGSWYSGVPLWSLAEGQGMRTAVLYWPGSEAEIAGHRPTWYAHFDKETESTEAMEQARIDSAAALLKLPSEERPHLIAMYYSEPDHEGHLFGPDAAETKAAVVKMDRLMGKLKAALDATKLPIDLVVVSDHGMAKIEGGWIALDQVADLSNFETVNSLLYGASEEDRTRVYNQLKKASSQYMAYRRKNLPRGLHFDENERAGDPIVIATGPYAIRGRGPDTGKPEKAADRGGHGFDPRVVTEMKASFFAAGPDILPGKTVAPFENVNLYPWMAHLLGLAPAKNDGNINVLAGILRDNGGEAAAVSSTNDKPLEHTKE